jgi:23S rRNA (adenine-N6)-dimethyltransferase
VSAAERTHWGYHQLSDPWARRLVAAAGIRPGELVVDVGAGTGALTTHLVAAGARVVAVELHPGRAHLLRTRFREAPVVVVQVDAADLRLPRHPFRVVANPPFGVTTALLRRLVSPGSRLISADLVVPAQVGAEWAGGRAPGATRWAHTFEARVVRRLPADAFRPPCPLATAVLRVERHGLGGADPNAPPIARAIVRAVFVGVARHCDQNLVHDRPYGPSQAPRCRDHVASSRRPPETFAPLGPEVN